MDEAFLPLLTLPYSPLDRSEIPALGQHEHVLLPSLPPSAFLPAVRPCYYWRYCLICCPLLLIAVLVDGFVAVVVVVRRDR